MRKRDIGYSKLTNENDSFEDDFDISNSENELPLNNFHSLEYLTIQKSTKRPYNDFETINWFHDLTSFPKPKMVPNSQKFKDKLWCFIKKNFEAGSGWIAVTMVGIITGLLALLLYIGITWLSDIKLGYCQRNFLFNQKECDWLLIKNSTDDTYIRSWVTYQEYFKSRGLKQQSAYALSYFIYVSASLFFAFLSAFIVKEIAPYSSFSGIPEVKTILGGFVIRGFLGFFTSFFKCVGIILSQSSSLVIGYESPLLHIGAATGNLVSRFFNKYQFNEAKKREILSSGSAAGLSAAFNAPISGLLFSYEEASYYFSFKTLWRTFWCTLIATLLRYHLYNSDSTPIVFSIGTKSSWKMFELIPFSIIGVFGALIGCFIIKMLDFLTKLNKNTNIGKYPLVVVFLVTLLISCISFLFPLARLDSYRLLLQLLGNCKDQDSFPTILCAQKNMNSTQIISSADSSLDGIFAEIKVLSYIMVFKIIFCILSSSLKIPSGYMFPLIVIGSILGRIVGHFVNIISFKYPFLFSSNYPSCQKSDAFCVDPRLYSIVGSAALLSGVTRLTVTIVVMIVEVTNGTVYIVPIMVSVILSRFIAELIVKDSIFQKSINLNNYPYLNYKINKSIVGTVSQIIQYKKSKPHYSSLRIFSQASTKVSDLYHSFEFPYYSFPIIEGNSSNILLGCVTSFDLHKALNQYVSVHDEPSGLMDVTFLPPDNTGQNTYFDLSPYVDKNPYTVTPDISIDSLYYQFNYLGLYCAYVTYHGEMMDIITKKDIISYLRHL